MILCLLCFRVQKRVSRPGRETVRGEKMKFYIHTWGCQMNVYDSERLADLLTANGYEEVSEAESADIILLNTCAVRENAKIGRASCRERV